MAEETEAKEGVQPKKPFLKFIILGVMVVVLGVAGFFVWDLFIKGNKEETKVSDTPEQIKSKKEEVRVICPLESFIVNLMDKAGFGKRYLKVVMKLEVGGDEDLKMVQTHKPQLRDTIILLLSSQSFRDINTIEGKLELKQLLLSRINQVLGKGIIRRIYFTEFVVQ